MTLKNRLLEEIARQSARADRALRTANKSFENGNEYREMRNTIIHAEALAKIEAYKDVLCMLEEEE